MGCLARPIEVHASLLSVTKLVSLTVTLVTAVRPIESIEARETAVDACVAVGTITPAVSVATLAPVGTATRQSTFLPVPTLLTGFVAQRAHVSGNADARAGHVMTMAVRLARRRASVATALTPRAWRADFHTLDAGEAVGTRALAGHVIAALTRSVARAVLLTTNSPATGRANQLAPLAHVSRQTAAEAGVHVTGPVHALALAVTVRAVPAGETIGLLRAVQSCETRQTVTHPSDRVTARRVLNLALTVLAAVESVREISAGLVARDSGVASAAGACASGGMALAVHGACAGQVAVRTVEAHVTLLRTHGTLPSWLTNAPAVVWETGVGVSARAEFLALQPPAAGRTLMFTPVPNVPGLARARAMHVVALSAVLARADLGALVAVGRRLARGVARESLPATRADAVARIRRALDGVEEVARAPLLTVLAVRGRRTRSLVTQLAHVAGAARAGSVLGRAGRGVDTAALLGAVPPVPSLVTPVLAPLAGVSRFARAFAVSRVTAGTIVARAHAGTVHAVSVRDTGLCAVSTLPAGSASACASFDVTGSAVLTETDALTILAVPSVLALFPAQRAPVAADARALAGVVAARGVVPALALVLAQVAIVTLVASLLAAHSHPTGVTDAVSILRVARGVTVTLVCTAVITVKSPPSVLAIGAANGASPAGITHTLVGSGADAIFTRGVTHGDALVIDPNVARATF